MALRPVRISLELIDPPDSTATAIAHSALSPEDDTRLIRIGLRPAHLLVKRALHRADTLHIRFVAALSLIEYCIFWSNTTDGRGVTNALRQAAGYHPDERAWGTGFASKLAISELLLPIDQLPIFGPSPKPGPHPLGTIKIVGRSPSDISRWQTHHGAPEAGEPIPKRSAKETTTGLCNTARLPCQTIKAALGAKCARPRALLILIPSPRRSFRLPLHSASSSVLAKC